MSDIKFEGFSMLKALMSWKVLMWLWFEISHFLVPRGTATYVLSADP